jgi:hypothetical protein
MHHYEKASGTDVVMDLERPEFTGVEGHLQKLRPWNVCKTKQKTIEA